MPFLMTEHALNVQMDVPAEDDSSRATTTSPSTLVRNRRKRFLDMHPEYFSADLELAGPLALSPANRAFFFFFPVYRRA